MDYAMDIMLDLNLTIEPTTVYMYAYNASKSCSVTYHLVLQISLMDQAWCQKIQTIGLGAHYKDSQSGTYKS